MFVCLSTISLIAAADSVRPAILVPLAIGCFVVALLGPIAAFRGVLHIPAFCGFALLFLVFGFVIGKLAGLQIRGSLPGVCLSIIFFLTMAACLGSVLAIFFYRQPET
jgi:hypothetical protein